MKKNLISFILLIFSLALIAQQKQVDEYIIKGDISGTYTGKVYLLDKEGTAQQRLDSAEVINGKYTFAGKNAAVPKMMYIESHDGQLAPFFMENGAIVIHTADPGNFWWSKQSNTINNELFKKMRMDETYSLSDSMRAEFAIQMLKYGQGSEEFENKEFKRRSAEGNRRSQEIRMGLVRRFPDEVISLYLLLNPLAYKMSPDSLESVLATISPAFVDHPYMKSLRNLLDSKKTGVGNKAPEFTATDKNGKSVSLAAYKGKYVLLDFWASWCGPCLREVPAMQRLHKKHGGERFAIIGISIDQDKDKWLAALKKHNMPWTQICDLKAWGGDLPVRYNVQAVPKTVLIDPAGNIIALDLRGEKLAQEMDTLLK